MFLASPSHYSNLRPEVSSSDNGFVVHAPEAAINLCPIGILGSQ